MNTAVVTSIQDDLVRMLEKCLYGNYSEASDYLSKIKVIFDKRPNDAKMYLGLLTTSMPEAIKREQQVQAWIVGNE